MSIMALKEPEKCNEYTTCVDGNPTPGKCSTGVVWSPTILACTTPAQVGLRLVGFSNPLAFQVRWGPCLCLAFVLHHLCPSNICRSCDHFCSVQKTRVRGSSGQRVHLSQNPPQVQTVKLLEFFNLQIIQVRQPRPTCPPRGLWQVLRVFWERDLQQGVVRQTHGLWRVHRVVQTCGGGDWLRFKQNHNYAPLWKVPGCEDFNEKEE